jgi:hypothetical protein
MGRFAWTEKSEKAALLLAQANLTQSEIAEAVGIERMSLWRWRQNPVFKARVDELVAEFRDEIRRIGIADKMKRVECLNRHWRLMQRVIADRANSEEMQDVPGGHTGLLVKTVKGVGKGDDFQLVTTYEVDTPTLREIREHMKQAAQELGQWADKVEIQSADDANPVHPADAEAGIAAMNKSADARKAGTA